MAIDVLKTTVREGYNHPELEWAKGSHLIPIATHRRENLSEPVLVIWDTTKRPEGIAAVTLKLVGTDEDVIYQNYKLLEDANKFTEVA
jgi:UDP-N-acetylglucosamine 2-epimerase